MSIEHVRHSLSHLLAMAVLKKYQNVRLGIGPAIENGFYYDFQVSALNESDLPELEGEMRKFIAENLEFRGEEVTPQEAKKLFKNQPFKLELIDEFAKEGKQITVYKTDGFADLCKGGHVKNTNEINLDAFKLTKLAGAYWRGSEKNLMLTRIYGVAFETKEELDRYLDLLDEAKKRDHKKLGKELDLFLFSRLVGPGLPLWTPKGTIVRNLLDDLVWRSRKKRGYQKVEIPHITKKELYVKSGHWDKFKDELFKTKTREGHEFAMKPMNCPHHIQIYSRAQWSWRDMPQRYASTTMCYRDEQTGELSGLSRLRSFTQDDSHLFCRQTQVKEEIAHAWKIVNEFYKKVGLETRVRISLHDPNNPKDYLGTPELWQKTESELKAIAKENGVVPEEALGEAAFYGPKIDFIAKDSLGREWQLATIQLDMNLPERFDLTYINEKGQKERIVMLHTAVMGSIERFLSIYLEHVNGSLPFWLAPVQVGVLPISDNQLVYAKTVSAKLEAKDIRTEVFSQNETIGKKIREGELQKIPYLLIAGGREMASEQVAVRKHGKGDMGQLTVDAFFAMLKKEELTFN
ncbi:MAG: threonine--tRNA ligase [Candidatus Portnoybacteria bacterium]|nr:threonine--tRNA ligase [Candidatus Portnoybacteria bacterium]